LRARDSGAFDLGLLGNEENEDGQAAGGGGGGAPLFALDEEEGQTVKPSHILGSVFVFALFSMLCYLMLWNVSTVSDELINPLITRGHGRNGTWLSGAGAGGQGGVDRAMLQDWANDPEMKQLVEEALLERMKEQDAKNVEFQQGLWNLTQLMENVAKKTELYVDPAAAADAVAASNRKAETTAILEEVEVLKEQIAAKQEENEQRQRQAEEETTKKIEQYEEQKQRAEAAVEKLQEKVKVMEAALESDKTETALMQGKIGLLSYNISSYQYTISQKLEGLGAAMSELKMEEKEQLIKEARATVEGMLKDMTTNPLVLMRSRRGRLQRLSSLIH
jgi:hypothetical protein